MDNNNAMTFVFCWSAVVLVLSLTRNASLALQSHCYFACYKPALMLCSFENDAERAKRKHRLERSTLANLQGLPPDLFESKSLHLVGRLDRDSEGLLLLTTDGQFTANVLSPNCYKTYWAYVKGCPNKEALEEMQKGGLEVRGATTRPPQEVRVLEKDSLILTQQLPPPALSMRRPGGTWLEVVLNEGKNRQVRKITAAAGHPTIRLCRVGIGGLNLFSKKWVLGECQPFQKEEILEGYNTFLD